MKLSLHHFSVVAFAALVSLMGCSSSDAASSERSGVTTCGSFANCQAGQHCSDPRLDKCSNGCLSDNNCAGNQTCVKSGGDVGTCKNNAPPAPTASQTTNPPTGTTCLWWTPTGTGIPFNPEGTICCPNAAAATSFQGTNICTRQPAQDASCTGVKLPAEAYDCRTSRVPTNTPTAQNTCGFSLCPAGQYCSDTTEEKCTPGCLSDVNCASNQTCTKTAGANVGVCNNK